jgi:hypothetical protein
MVTFSLQVQPENAAEWVDTARRAEAAGFAALYAADHPGACAAPHVALAAAAAVTSTIRLGAYVVNAGVREPMLLAADVATLDVVSLGESELQAVPYLLIGTEDEIVAKIRENERRWGITRYAVRRSALEALPAVMARLQQ